MIIDFIDVAIAREKQIKGLSRAKKINLINSFNPAWDELFSSKGLFKSGEVVSKTNSSE
jgi:predicted GIY-YIG superfamily endonuclease